MKRIVRILQFSLLLIAVLNLTCERSNEDNILHWEHLYGRWELVSQDYAEYEDGIEIDRVWAYREKIPLLINSFHRQGVNGGLDALDNQASSMLSLKCSSIWSASRYC